MGNCPNCGAELGVGIAFCPNCGGDLGGEASDITETHEVDSVSDTIGESAVGHAGEGGAGRAEQVDAPDTSEPPEEFETPQGEEWVTGDVQPRETTLELDAGVPGSEVPPSHGGGWTQQGEDGTAPPEIIHGTRAVGPATELPEDPRPDLGVDDSGRGFKPGFNAGLAIAILGIVVIVVLSGWYLMGDDGDGNGDGNGEGNGEPNGNGDDPLKSVHVYREGTSGTYPFEPPGEYHITVAIRNNGSRSVDLTGYSISVTVWIDWVVKGFNDLWPTGAIGAGETRTFDLVVETEVLGGGDTITVGISLRKDDGDTHVHTINYEQTI